MVAVLNNGGGFYSAELYVHEARKSGGNIQVPCVNKSHYATWLYDSDIYLGFHLLDGLESAVALRLIKERKANGLFLSLDNFLKRVPISIEQLSVLIRINAFRFTKIDKRTLLWKAHLLLNTNPYKGHKKLLFEQAPKSYNLPRFEILDLENAFDEIELLGFPLCSPFLLLETSLPNHQIGSKDLAQYQNKMITLYGYLVTVKNTSTSNGKRMQFGTFLDHAGDWIDTVHFPPVAKRYPFRGKGIYQLRGKVIEEFGFYTLEVTSLERMAYVEDVRFSMKKAILAPIETDQS